MIMYSRSYIRLNVTRNILGLFIGTIHLMDEMAFRDDLFRILLNHFA